MIDLMWAGQGLQKGPMWPVGCKMPDLNLTGEVVYGVVTDFLVTVPGAVELVLLPWSSCRVHGAAMI